MVEEVISGNVPEDKRLIVAICYVLTWLGGIILLLIGENDRTMKFHAMQAIVLGIIAMVLGFITCGILAFVIWLYMLYGAYMIYTTGNWRSVVANFVESSLMK